MRYINSVANEHIKELAKLHLKKHRDETKTYLVDGFHLVEMAKDYLIEILTTNEKYVNEDLQNVPVVIVTEDIIAKLSQTKTPQPIIGVCHYQNNCYTIGNRIVLLDGLQDPGNIGTIFRSALAFGIDTIVLSKDCVDIYNDKVIRASQGAIFELSIMQEDLDLICKKIKEKNIPLIGTALSNSIPLNRLVKTSSYGIILGNEGNGVKKEILSLTDYNVCIPMSNRIESLNVAIAGSILMYYLF